MYRRSIFAFTLVWAVVACGGPDKNLETAAYGPVRISTACNPDGSLGAVSISSWAARLPNEKVPFRFFNDSPGNHGLVIKAQNPNYPFAGRSYTAAHGGYVDGKPVGGTPAGSYKYSITITCPVSGGSAKENIIDPDMIIPWKITQN